MQFSLAALVPLITSFVAATRSSALKDNCTPNLLKIVQFSLVAPVLPITGLWLQLAVLRETIVATPSFFKKVYFLHSTRDVILLIY